MFPSPPPHRLQGAGDPTAAVVAGTNMFRETRQEISFGSRGPRTFSLPFVFLLPFVLCSALSTCPSSGAEVQNSRRRLALSEEQRWGKRSVHWDQPQPECGGWSRRRKRSVPRGGNPPVKVAPGQAAELGERGMGDIAPSVLPAGSGQRHFASCYMFLPPVTLKKTSCEHQMPRSYQ